MLKFLLAVHLVLAVFVIGPLVWAATTAGRGVRKGDGAATASSARVLTIYAYASVLVVIAGMALMSQKQSTSAYHGRYTPLNSNGESAYSSTLAVSTDRHHVAEFGDTWIWLSLVLWAVAVAITLGVIVPTLKQVTKLIEAQESVVTITARVAAAGGVVGLIFVVVVVLMAYKPGS